MEPMGSICTTLQDPPATQCITLHLGLNGLYNVGVFPEPSDLIVKT